MTGTPRRSVQRFSGIKIKSSSRCTNALVLLTDDNLWIVSLLISHLSLARGCLRAFVAAFNHCNTLEDLQKKSNNRRALKPNRILITWTFIKCYPRESSQRFCTATIPCTGYDPSLSRSSSWTKISSRRQTRLGFCDRGQDKTGRFMISMKRFLEAWADSSLPFGLKGTLEVQFIQIKPHFMQINHSSWNMQISLLSASLPVATLICIRLRN